MGHCYWNWNRRGDFLMTIRQRVKNFGQWAERNHMALIYAAGALVLLLLLLWTTSILAGFWLSGLWGYKFELGVGNSGIATIATAGATIYGIARAAQAKYATDSKYNSADKTAPYRKEDV